MPAKKTVPPSKNPGYAPGVRPNSRRGSIFYGALDLIFGMGPLFMDAILEINRCVDNDNICCVQYNIFSYLRANSSVNLP